MGIAASDLMCEFSAWAIKELTVDKTLVHVQDNYKLRFILLSFRTVAVDGLSRAIAVSRKILQIFDTESHRLSVDDWSPWSFPISNPSPC